MEEDSKKYLAIDTRIEFGITSAPAIWQHQLTKCWKEHLVQVVSLMIRSLLEGMMKLEEVLRWLQHHGLRANKAKCEFFKEKITYCRHDIDNNGLHKSAEKEKAVLKALHTNNVVEVRSFLG